MLNLPLVNSASWKGVNSIVANILAYKSVRWDEFFNCTGKPLGKACGC